MTKPAVAPLVACFLALSQPVGGELFCGARSYASADNAGCTACPAHTARLFQDPATAAGANSTVDDCLCEEGYYDARGPSSSSNAASCEACPPGATCDGLHAPPRALAGFWRLAGTNADPQPDELFWPCSPWHACESTAAAAFVAEEGLAISTDSVGYAGDGSNLNETTLCAGHRTGARCDGIAPGFRLVGSGAYELACVPAVGSSFAGSPSYGGGLFWSAAPALLVVLFWAWAGLWLLKAQRSRPPPPPTSIVNRYFPFFGVLAWLRACPPLDAALLSQAAALVLRLPLAWPQSVRPWQVAASVLLLDVAAWTPCGGWAGLVTDSRVSAGALFGGAWAGRFGDVATNWFGDAVDSEDTALARQDGQLASAFAGTLRAHSFLLVLLLVLPPWVLRLSFTHARRSLPGGLLSKKRRPAKSWFRLSAWYRWCFCSQRNDNGCALVGAGCGTACTFGLCTDGGCLCACGDPSDHRGRTSRAAAGNARAVLYAGVLARLLLPVSLLRVVEAVACIESGASSWALADPEELTCGSARHKGLILEACVGLFILVLLQLHSGLPTLLYRHRRTPYAPPHAWHSLRQAFAWGLGVKLTEDLLGAHAPGAKHDALQTYRDGGAFIGRCHRRVGEGLSAWLSSCRVLDMCWRRGLAPVLGVLYRSFVELFWSADTTPPMLALAALSAASAVSPLALAYPAALTAAASVVVLASLGCIPLIADRGLTSLTDAVPATFAVAVAVAAAFCGTRFLPAAVTAAATRNHSSSDNDDGRASRLSSSGLPWRARVDAGTPEPHGMAPWLDLIAVVGMALALIAPVLSAGLSCWHCRTAAAQRKRVHQAAAKAHAALQASHVARQRKSPTATNNSPKTRLASANATTGPLAQLQRAEGSAASARKQNLVSLEVDLKQLETFATSDALLRAVSSAKSNQNRDSLGSSGGPLTPAESAAALHAHATLVKGAQKAFLNVEVDVRVPRIEGSADPATGLSSSPVVHRREVAFVTTRNDAKATRARRQAGTGPGGSGNAGGGGGGGGSGSSSGDGGSDAEDDNPGGAPSNTWSWVPLATLEGGTLAPWVMEVPTHAKGRATVHVTVSTRSGKRLALWDGIVPADKLLHRGTANGHPSTPSLDALPLYSPSTAKAAQQLQQEEVGGMAGAFGVLAHPWTLKLLVGYTDPAAVLEAAALEQAKDAEAAAMAGASSLALLNASWSDVAPEDAAWVLARGLECIDFAAGNGGGGSRSSIPCATSRGSQALRRVLLAGAQEANEATEEEDARAGARWLGRYAGEEKRSDDLSSSSWGPSGASRGSARDESSSSSSLSTLTPARRAERLVQLLLSLGSHRDALQRRKDGAVRQAKLEQLALGIWDEEEDELVEEEDNDGHGIGSSGIPAAQRSAARAAALFEASEECDDVSDDRDGDYDRFLSRLVELYPGTVASLASSRFTPPERALLATLMSRLKLRLKRRTHELPGRCRRRRRQRSRRTPRHGGGSGGTGEEDGDDDDNDGGGDTSSEEEHESDLAAAGLGSMSNDDGISAGRSGHNDELRIAGRAIWPFVLPSARGALAAALLAPPEGDSESTTSRSHRMASGAPEGRAATYVALRQMATANRPK